MNYVTLTMRLMHLVLRHAPSSRPAPEQISVRDYNASTIYVLSEDTPECVFYAKMINTVLLLLFCCFAASLLYIFLFLFAFLSNKAPMLSQFTLSNEPCAHTWSESDCRVPSSQVVVHRDECAYCCAQAHQGDGIFVCMTCFAGVCCLHIAKHRTACGGPGHSVYTRLKEHSIKVPDATETKNVDSLCLVPTKTYDVSICCGACLLQFDTSRGTTPGMTGNSFNAIINTPVPGAAAPELTNAEFSRLQCEHVLTLKQTNNPFKAAGGPPTGSSIKCSENTCSCSENCWMCMTCGWIGCSRPTSGGNGHALTHFENTRHPCSVKLGTITPTGADIYCYLCDDLLSDNQLDHHMRFFGVDIRTAKKTAKTMGELEYDYSTSFDFNKITEEGEELELVSGPGRTGIKNIGNSCYLSSVIQCLFAMDQFKGAFYRLKQPHQAACTRDPYQCHHCQMERVADGLLSGTYSLPPASGTEDANDVGGICPRLLKNTFAGHHPEFSTGSQQDAQEYLVFFLEKLQQYVCLPDDVKAAIGGTHPASLFNLKLEQRTSCYRCKKVKYKTEEDSCLSVAVPVDQQVMASVSVQNALLPEQDKTRPTYELSECINVALGTTRVDCRCEACGAMTTYANRLRLESFPDILPVFIKRAYFDMATLSTKKFEAYVKVPQEIDLSFFRAQGPVPGETLMKGDDESQKRVKTEGPSSSAPSQPAMDDVALATVLSMGVEPDVAAFALRRNKMSVEKAIEYLFSGVDVEAEIANEASMGAVESESGNAQRSVTDGAGKYRLMAMVSHIGASAKTGHYVCHIKEKETGRWLLFNDEKVGVSHSPPFELATIYFFERMKS